MRRSAVTAALCLLAAMPGSAQDLAWVHQLGSQHSDQFLAAAQDGSGGVYAGLYTGGSTSSKQGPWILRTEAGGAPVWAREVQTTPSCLAADGSGGVFACGGWWIARLDEAGDPLWQTTLGSVPTDSAEAVVSAGAGGAFVGGRTQWGLAGFHKGGFDAWFGRLDGAGQPIWLRQIGTIESDWVEALAPDGVGGVYVVGLTGGALGGPNASGYPDIWLARYDAAGQQAWIVQMGSSDTEGIIGVTAAADGAGGVYVSADTFGDLAGPNAGDADVWVARLDGTGTVLWTRQFGTSHRDAPTSAVGEATGGLVLAGNTYGALGGPAAGDADLWLARYDSAGNQVSIAQYGTAQRDEVTALAAGVAGQVFAVGWTYGALAQPNAGGPDAWIARIDPGCNLATTYCSASATSVPGCQAAIHGTGVPSLASPGSFSIASGNVPGGTVGLCFFGVAGPASLPIGSLGGLVCVAAPFHRTAPQPGGGSAGVCNGHYEFTLQDLIASSPVVSAGAVIHASIWARDPANPDTFLLSDGLEFGVCP